MSVPRINISGQKIYLRDFLPEDFSSVHEYASSADVARWQEWGPNTAEQTLAYLESCLTEPSLQPRPSYNLAIIEKAGGLLVGACALFIRRPMREAEIGFSLNPKYWNLGYATDAARTMIQFAFEDLGIHRIYATCRPENVASASVLKKVGMMQEGVLRENVFIRGIWMNSLIFSIISSRKKHINN